MTIDVVLIVIVAILSLTNIMLRKTTVIMTSVTSPKVVRDQTTHVKT